MQDATCKCPRATATSARADAPRLLLVSYEFPPKGGTQSQWVAKLAAGLADRGWKVEVLSVADPPTALLDEGLLDEVAGRVSVTRTYSLEPTRLVQAFRRLKSQRYELATDSAVDHSPKGASKRPRQATPGTRSYTSAPPWLVKLAKALFVPDEKVGWVPWAVSAGVNLHAEKPFNVVVTTGPPHSAHIIGRRLKRRLHIPWIANLMDPIVDYYAFKPATPLNAYSTRRYERRLLKHVDRATIATETMRRGLLQRNPDAAGRVSVLPNCFDPADFHNRHVRDSKRFVISYVGVFQLTISPDVFLEAVAALAARDARFAHDVRVRLVGPQDAQTDRAIETTGTEDLVDQAGFLSHAAATRAMAEADVLLLVLGPEPEASAILTSKLPEYLASGRAILALVPEGEAADLVRRAGAGEVVAPDSVEAVGAALGRLYRRWQDGALPRPDPRVVAEYACGPHLSDLDKLIRGLLQ